MAKIYFYNQDCVKNMERMASKNYKVDLILTSPPYATSRSKVKTQKALDTYNRRYDICLDDLDEKHYSAWTVNIFNHIDQCLSKDGVVLWNVSYGNENPSVMWLAMADIIRETNFMIADTIIWKKSAALPNNVGNKLTRICEWVFVLCRKSEYKTYRINKKVKSVREDTGQKYYENIYNFIEAKNNDGATSLNKATYSSELCLQLLNLYATNNTIVYDPFMGTGTTAIACDIFCPQDTMTCIGTELSPAQVQFSKDRLVEYRKTGKTYLKIKKEKKEENETEGNENSEGDTSGND